METQENATKRRTYGRPFEPGNPGGPGRRSIPPEKRQIQRRVVADLAAELKLAADLAVDRLVTIVQNPKAKDSDAVSAAREILDRSFGRAVQAIDARVQYEDQSTMLTSEDIRRAALLVASRNAEDA